MESTPSTLRPRGNDAAAANDGRLDNGRFAPGNRLGRGNPLAGRAAKIRAVLLEALTEEDAKAIAERLIEMAKSGDLAAVRELLDRTVGKCVQADLLERIEALEANGRQKEGNAVNG